MLIAIVTTFLLLTLCGGGHRAASDQFRQQVKAHVPDKARQEKVIDISQQLSKQQAQIVQSLSADVREFEGTCYRYPSTSADFDAAAAKLSADQKAMTKAILDAHDAMKAQMTAKEWAAVYGQTK